MSRLQLVVTGQCERAGLHKSLGVLFPDVEFAVPVMVDSITSTPLTDPPPRGLLTNLDKFAAKLVELVDENDETLVVGIDDLELNQRPERATDEVRSAVERVLKGDLLASSLSKRRRLEAQVAQRCSFHLFAPMLEAYFFGEPAALGRAGAKRPSLFDPTRHDLEDFVVNDAAFLEPTDESDPAGWRRGGINRARHPKRYLRYLVEPDFYRETIDGVAALQSLAWPQVLGSPGFTQFGRALVRDVAAYFDLESRIDGEEHPLTSIGTPRPMRVLRNL